MFSETVVTRQTPAPMIPSAHTFSVSDATPAQPTMGPQRSPKETPSQWGLSPRPWISHKPHPNSFSQQELKQLLSDPGRKTAANDLVGFIYKKRKKKGGLC